MLKKIIFIFLLSLLVSPAWSAIEEYGFELKEHEDRFKHLIAEMRCPMCLNSNLAGSDAPIASNLRGVIYDQILAGQSDDEIMAFMKERYGEFISYRPPLNRSTFLLWFGPGLLLIAGFFILLRMTRSSQVVEDDALSSEESEQLDKFLKSEGDKK